VQAAKIPGVERERQQRIDEMAAENGPRWPDAFKPGSFGCHELLDRTMMAANIVDEYVLSHPACVQDPEWFALARQAADALAELYQRIGAAHLDEESSETPQRP
jgi:hypothetical protein